MAATILDGRAIAGEILAKLRVEIEELKKKGKGPHLVAVQANEDPGSRVYVKSQKKTCEDLGIAYTLDELPPTSSEEALLAHIQKRNADPTVTGIIIQTPLPEGVSLPKIQASITREKDVEGMNPANLGMLIYGNPRIGPCTPMGAVELVKRTGVKIEGAATTVIGHSNIVGKPIAVLMLGLNASVSCVHIFTKDIRPYVKQADILFVATGKISFAWQAYSKALKKHQKDPSVPKPPLPDLSPLVTADMIKPGAVVIDVAINRIPEALDANGEPVKDEKGKPKMKIVGDVDFEGCKAVASFITPVPGGCGEMTVAMLLSNTVEAAKMLA